MNQRMLVFICVAALWLSGCERGTSQSPSGEGSPVTNSQSVGVSSQPEKTLDPPANSSQLEGGVAYPPQEGSGASSQEDTKQLHPYLEELVDGIVTQIYTPGMSEYERTKAAFDYMVEHTILDEPIGLDLWRVHGGGDQPIPYLQQRALSPLRFGVGMCEDYAAALTLLLRGMGLEAQYVPGLTYSVEGNLVDHAWTVVRIDGVWYHLDSQLEDNISRHGSIRYRYFLKGDATMSGSHRWGQNLINTGLLTPEQNREIAEDYPTPACPQDYPSPDRYMLEDGAAPNLEALRLEAEGEVAAWEGEHGPLEPMQLNTVPPVFGLEGFGPPDEG